MFKIDDVNFICFNRLQWSIHNARNSEIFPGIMHQHKTLNKLLWFEFI